MVLLCFDSQIKLLLQQQNAPLPTPHAPLTPPRTPQFDSSCGNNKPLDDSPVSMVTACTNTGASLLLGTPLKPSGKKSAATSPMKENEMKHRRRFVNKLLLQCVNNTAGMYRHNLSSCKQKA